MKLFLISFPFEEYQQYLSVLPKRLIALQVAAAAHGLPVAAGLFISGAAIGAAGIQRHHLVVVGRGLHHDRHGHGVAHDQRLLLAVQRGQHTAQLLRAADAGEHGRNVLLVAERAGDACANLRHHLGRDLRRPLVDDQQRHVVFAQFAGDGAEDGVFGHISGSRNLWASSTAITSGLGLLRRLSRQPLRHCSFNSTYLRVNAAGDEGWRQTNRPANRCRSGQTRPPHFPHACQDSPKCAQSKLSAVSGRKKSKLFAAVGQSCAAWRYQVLSVSLLPSNKA